MKIDNKKLLKKYTEAFNTMKECEDQFRELEKSLPEGQFPDTLSLPFEDRILLDKSTVVSFGHGCNDPDCKDSHLDMSISSSNGAQYTVEIPWEDVDYMMSRIKAQYDEQLSRENIVEDTDEMVDAIMEDFQSEPEEVDEVEKDDDDRGPLKKYTVMGERVLNTAWTYTVMAHDEDEAIEMVENCPDGYCDDITHNDDENVYEDDITYSVTDVEEIEEEPKKKKSKKKKK